MLALMSFVCALPFVEATGSRMEVREYVVNTAECNLPTVTVARLCFGLDQTEHVIHVELRETSPAAQLELPIVAVIRFTGVASFTFDVCGEREIRIPSGATGFLVEVQQGLRSGFCATNDISPATKGTVTVTFS